MDNENAQTSKYNTERCYIYNKAFARFYDNHTTHDHNVNTPNVTPPDLHIKDQYNGKTKAGALSPTGVQDVKPKRLWL